MSENVFPRTGVVSGGPVQLDQSGGLTKREYFAALAMQALVSDCDARQVRDEEETARDAIAYADALLAKLGQKS